MTRKFFLGAALGAAVMTAALYAASGTPNSSLVVNSDDSSVVAPPSASGSLLQNAMAQETALPAQNRPSEGEIRAIVRDEIAKNPALVMDAVRADPKAVMDALNGYVQKQQKDAQAELNAKTLKAEPLLTVADGYPSIGNPQGKVELFYFFDVNCHYCKQIDPDLKRFIAENPDVKVVHREMPILAASSRYAAVMAGIVFATHPDFYEEFHRKLMERKPGMTEADVDATVTEVLGQELSLYIITATRSKSQDPNAREVADRITATLKAADAAGVTGTPFIIVKDSGLVIRGAEQDAFAKLQSMAVRARQKHAGDAAK